MNGTSPPLHDVPHRRRNLLTGEWVLVSPHRMKRPWQGENLPPKEDSATSYDQHCYLCPGNSRSAGERNPDYSDTYVFANDFPALLDELPPQGDDARKSELLSIEPVRGEAHVICYSPDHSQTLANMDGPARRKVVDTWCNLSRELGERWSHVQIFENRGAMMGASSPHPHGQLWASDFVPDLVEREDERQRRHLANHGIALLDDVLAVEISEKSRVVAQNDSWLAIVPHWAAWPYELLIIARSDARRLEDLSQGDRAALAMILGKVLHAGDALFDTPFPYSMGWHGAPHSLKDDDTAHWRLHAHVLPPLLRSASVRKHMVGFELLAETQRDLTPEMAARQLREHIAV